MDTYSDPEAKMRLVVASAQVAKDDTVRVDGVGEDIPFSLMVWRDHALTAVCQMDRRLMTDPPGERLVRTMKVAEICRRGFDATAFSFVTEGYCALDPTDVNMDEPLAAQFVHNVSVSECLAVTHVEAGNVYLAAVPYRYEVGRRVEWGEVSVYEPVHPGGNAFLAGMVEVLLVDGEVGPLLEDPVEWGAVVAEEVSEWGFHVEFGLDLDVA